MFKPEDYPDGTILVLKDGYLGAVKGDKVVSMYHVSTLAYELEERGAKKWNCLDRYKF